VKQLIRIALLVITLFTFAPPARADKREPVPLPPPAPVNQCGGAGSCALVCHVPEHRGRHWMWVQTDKLEQWLAAHPDDYVYRARIDEVSCSEYHGWFPLATNGGDLFGVGQ
jgi:hypothetical protein